MGHTHDNNTSSKQSKYKYTMKFTRLIASTLMLLVVLMASTASARSIAFPEPQKFCCNAISAQCEACKAGVSVEEICRTWVVDSSDPLSFHSIPLEGCPKKQPKACCRANSLECQACIADVSEEEFCRRDPHSHVCPQKPDNKPSHPDNCYSSIWNTEIRHGETGARKCCWYGKWEKKSKCEKNPPVTHPDNCSPLSGTLKSGMVRWAQESAAGTESGRRSPSARRTHQSLILISATPLSGTLKSGMVRWAQESAAGTVTGSASLSAMVVTRMIKLFCFCDYIPLAQAQVQWKKKAHVNFVRCKITM